LSLSLNPNPAARIFLADITQLQSATNNASEQVSSGYKVTQASDDPDQISDLLQLEANLQSNNQITTNLSNVKAQVDTGESALNSAVQFVQQAISLGTEGANSITTAAQQQTLAQQVQDIQSQLVAIANTNVNGTYIFSGDDGSSPSYQLDSTSPTGVDRLITTQATQQIEDTNGVAFSIGETAQTIFDNRNPDDTVAANNVFSAINSLQVALTSNNTAGVTTALASLQTASAYLDQQQAFYGTVQVQVATSTTAAQTQNISLTAQIGGIRDADLTQAATQLTQGQTAETAAYSAQAELPNKSLFDYLG
jgi:flagellar hook-associated protein 3 FlgL